MSFINRKINDIDDQKKNEDQVDESFIDQIKRRKREGIEIPLNENIQGRTCLYLFGICKTFA